ncbi:MAG: site-specific integrase [Gammaproteobacteria bacterium]
MTTERALVALEEQIRTCLDMGSAPSTKVARPERTQAYYRARSKSRNTFKAYRSSIKDFLLWARWQDDAPPPLPLPAYLIGEYLTQCAAKYAPSTVAQRVNALSWVHFTLGLQDPTKDQAVREVMMGIRNVAADEDNYVVQRAPAFTADHIVTMVNAMSDDMTNLRDLRDRAYLLVGVHGAFRQSELNGLTVGQLELIEGQGYAVNAGVVKTDQDGSKGLGAAIPFRTQRDKFCPATALQDWLKASGIKDGPVFRTIMKNNKLRPEKITPLSHTSSNGIIKKWAVYAVGEKRAANYSGHSLRASYVTIQRSRDVPDARIARQTHHMNLQMMSVYDRPADYFKDNPVTDLANSWGDG